MPNFGKIAGVLKQLAPGLATALGGPFAGMAVASITGAVTGDPKATSDAVEQTILGATNPDALLRLKQAEEDFQAKMAQLGIDHEKIAADDRASARQMQEQVKSALPPLLSVLVVTCSFFAEGYILLHGVPSAVDPIVMGRILGTLDAALMLVLSYYFGSSAGSDRKTELLANGKGGK